VTYLAVQIRQSSKATRSATRSEIVKGQAELNFRMADNPELAVAAYALLKGEEINDIDRLAAGQLLAAGFRGFENQHFAYVEGDFPESIWLGYRANIALNAQQPNFSEFWNDRRQLFSAEFVKFIDELASEKTPLRKKGLER
jgi:hypothetical protein